MGGAAVPFFMKQSEIKFDKMKNFRKLKLSSARLTEVVFSAVEWWSLLPLTRPEKRWATADARLHAKTALGAELSCGRSFPVVSSGCVGARWFEDTTRMSMTVVVRGALCVFAGGAWALLGHTLHKDVRRVK